MDNSNFFNRLSHSLNLEDKRRQEMENKASLASNEAPLENEMSQEQNQENMQGEANNMETQNEGMDNNTGNEMENMEPSNENMDNNVSVEMNEDNISTMSQDMEKNEMDENIEGESMMEEENEENTDPPTAELTATMLRRKTKEPKTSKSAGLLRPIDVYETKSEIIVKAIVAGVERNEIQVTVTPEKVTISGERQRKERVSQDSYFYQEFFWGSFSRSIMLPVEINPEKTKASLKNGIFTIRLPKLSQQKEKILSMKDIEIG